MKMERNELIQLIKDQRSFLCVGLDSDPDRIPTHLHAFDDPVLEFNKRIIDATKDYCVAYKPNLAFYESLGAKGWKTLEDTLAYIPKSHFTIADAKRGDIGNTSAYYAKAFFETMDFDALTVAPYMGHDSVTPFQGYSGKWVVLLALTSNQGALDFQLLRLELSGKRLFEKVLARASEWGNTGNLMFVVGATRGDLIRDVRAVVPDHFLLVPGIGAQGGSLAEVCKYGMNQDCGLLVNASRSILYASEGEDFALAAEKEAINIRQQMETELVNKGIIDPS